MRVYLVLCVSSFLAGYGILAALGLSRKLNGALLAAPGMALTALILVVGNGIWFGVSMANLAIAVALATLAFGVYGAVDLSRAVPRRRDCVAAIVAAVCPLILLVTFFRWGLTRFPGSWYYDGWSYIANGQAFIDRFDPTKAESITSLYSMSFWEISARYISSGVIAVLSVLTGGVDAQAGFGAHLALSVLAYAGACGFMAIAWGRPAAIVVLFMLVSATGCWILGVVQSNNLDSLLIVALIPLLLALSRQANAFSLRDGALFGLVVAAMLWSQVELLPIAGAIVAFELARRFWTSARPLRRWAEWAAAASATAVLAAAVWIRPSMQYFLLQFQSAGDGTRSRPGAGFFLGLLDAKCAFPAAWGFWGTGEFWGAGDRCVPLSFVLFLTAVAALFTICLIVGATRLVRSRDYGLPCALAFIVAGATYMILVRHYDYGAYKFLSTGWFIAAFMMVEGVAAMAFAMSLAPVLAYGVVAVILLGPQATILSMRLARFEVGHPHKSIAFYRKALEIREIVGGAPLVVALSEGVTAQWFVFFLRDMDLVMVNRPHAYFESFDVKSVSQTKRRAAIGKVQWVATDLGGDLSCRDFKMVWEGGPYRLWKSEAPSEIFSAELAKPQPAPPSLREIRCSG